MNKSFRVVVALVVAALVLSAFAAQAQSRIATVELTQVFEKYWKTKRARAALADHRADLKKELDQMTEAHKKLMQDYQKILVDANDQAVSAEEREKRRRQAEAKQKEVNDSNDMLKQFVSRGDAELEQKTRRMMDDVLKDIREAVAAKGRAGGYAYVLDSTAEALSRAPVLLYNSGESDITTQVVEQLNATAPPEPVTR